MGLGRGPALDAGRIWGRRGQTQTVTVTDGSNKRVSLAALIAVKAGQRRWLVYRVDPRRTGEKRKGFTGADYATLLDAAHQQLGGRLVLVCGNLNTTSARR